MARRALRLVHQSPASRHGAAQEPEAPPFGKALGFMQVLWSVSHGLQSLSKHMEGAVGVTAPQRIALRIIGRQPGLSAGQLAEVLRLSPGTLTGVLRRLEEHGLVVRETDPDDSRRALFHLTDSGEELAERRVGTVEGAVRRALLKLDDQELAATARALRLVVTELEAETHATGR